MLRAEYEVAKLLREIKIGYIGFSAVMLRMLADSPFFDLKVCITEKRRITDELRSLCQENRVGLLEVANRAEMTTVLSEFGKETYFLMYENGIIIDKASLPDTHIYNFHTGSFLNNRGAHPISWSILNGDFYTEMTMHEIDAQIDQGTRLDTRVVKVDGSDDILTLKNKLEATIPELLVSLYNHILKREYFKQNFNQYNRRVVASDYTIDLEKDSAEQMMSKVRSQRSYKGAILAVEGENVYIQSMKETEHEGRLLKKEGSKYYIEVRQVLEAIGERPV